MYPKSLHCSETRVPFWESMTGHIWTCFICIKHLIWGPSTFLFEQRALRYLNECLHLPHDTCPEWWIFLFFFSSTLTSHFQLFTTENSSKLCSEKTQERNWRLLPSLIQTAPWRSPAQCEATFATRSTTLPVLCTRTRRSPTPWSGIAIAISKNSKDSKLGY